MKTNEEIADEIRNSPECIWVGQMIEKYGADFEIWAVETLSHERTSDECRDAHQY